MPIERVFLGWDAPITTKVREYLLPKILTGPVDLGHQLIIVPTRQAGRRLREALALHCASQNTALLSPIVRTPSFLLEADNKNIATPTQIAAVWAGVLMKTGLDSCSSLFSAPVSNIDFSWGVNTGMLLQSLRETLAEGGCSINDVYTKLGEALEEQERWQQMATLEAAYLARMDELGFSDKCTLSLQSAEHPVVPNRFNTIILAGVPDPIPNVLLALVHIAESLPIIILIHAPESESGRFDDWGRPITEKWLNNPIAIPDPSANIFLTSNPITQSKTVLNIIAEQSNRFDAANTAIGVPDTSIIPMLIADLAERGVMSFDPAGKQASEHQLYRLLNAYRTLVSESSYTALSGFLRHADVLDCLYHTKGISAHKLLKEMDTFQNDHIPANIADMVEHLPRDKATTETQDDFSSLRTALDFIKERLAAFPDSDLDNAIRTLLQALYQNRTVNADNPDDEEFIKVAERIDDALHEITDSTEAGISIEKQNGMDLLLWRLSTQRYFTERKGAILDLEGWLELPWNEAPLMIITGMNDGFVPDSHPGDIFLPDSLRKQIGLRHDDDRLARDSYLMRSLIESRKTGGRICFLINKTSTTRDPLKPSRLLFRCNDEELVERASLLFAAPADAAPNYPASVSFKLDAAPPADIEPDKLHLHTMYVTQFRDYLTCPFRFYLKHILRMKELSDTKRELDALDFGILAHEALNDMGNDEMMKRCDNEWQLHAFLCKQAEAFVQKRYGATPSLQIQIQLEVAKRRLLAAAWEQVRLVKDGWEIIACEKSISTSLNGMRIAGKIDRIDLHRSTGVIRILDYKTSEVGKTAEEKHLQSVPKTGEIAEYAKITVNNRAKRWIDLQLPLYVILLGEDHTLEGKKTIGYFNLPRSINETGISIWENFDETILRAAQGCAENIIAAIRNRVFWPPAEKLPNDDFASLFQNNEARQCINETNFAAFMEEKKL